jgi:hypothetical protein
VGRGRPSMVFLKAAATFPQSLPSCPRPRKDAPCLPKLAVDRVSLR